MNRKLLLAVTAAAAVAALAWDLLCTPPEAPAATAVPSAQAASAAGAAAANAVRPVVPGPAGTGSAANFLRPAALSLTTSTPLAREFASALAWKPIYERLKGSAEGHTHRPPV